MEIHLQCKYQYYILFKTILSFHFHHQTPFSCLKGSDVTHYTTLQVLMLSVKWQRHQKCKASIPSQTGGSLLLGAGSIVKIIKGDQPQHSFSLLGLPSKQTHLRLIYFLNECRPHYTNHYAMVLVVKTWYHKKVGKNLHKTVEQPQGLSDRQSIHNQSVMWCAVM